MKTVEPPQAERTPARATSAQPRVLDRYRLTDLLAVGGSAEVWRALDEATGHAVAVKLLHPHLVPDVASRERITGEARAVASLSHPGIIRVLDIDPGPRPAIVLELVDGEPLSARLGRDGPMPPRAAARVAASLADALYHAHVHGVIHRDVKPGNVLLARDGRPRLVDFGIARVLGDSAAGQTQTGLVMGTLRYMAPEQLAGEAVTPRVDLYGLGAVMHELVTGHPPYEPTSPVGLLEAQAAGPPTLPGVDPALEAVVRACLRNRPEERPRHAGIVAAALRAWLAGDESAAMALDTPPRLEEATRTAVVPRSRPAGSRAAARLQPLVALGIAVLLLAGGIVGVAGLGGLSRAAAPLQTPIPSAAAAPAWASSLSAAYQRDCGSDPESAGAAPAQLVAMGQAAAGRYVDALTAACRSAAAGSSGGGAGDGHGKGGGHGHGRGHG